MFGTLRSAGYGRTLRLFVLIIGTTLVWTLALLMPGNWSDSVSATTAKWTMIGFAMVLTMFLAFRLVQRIALRARSLFHPPVALRVDVDGVHQTAPDGRSIDLKWEDIRLIQHTGPAHIVRGANKSQRIKISTQLEDNKSVSSFLKFAFLLRQETGDSWRGLLTEVEARLSGPGFHFHYDRDRTDTVFINNQGIKHSSADGVESDMSWDLMRGSVMDVQKDHLRFRHTGTKTSIAVPRGTDSDEVIEELIRWALHTAPGFTHTSP